MPSTTLAEDENASEDVRTKATTVSLLKALETAVRRANDLAQGDELELLEAFSPEIEEKVRGTARRIIASIKSVASRYAVSSNDTDSDSGSNSSDASAGLTPRDILSEKVSETTDEALENFNASLDSARGIRNAVVTQPGAMSPNFGRLLAKNAHLGKQKGGCLDIEKSQVHFPDYPIDNSDTVFVSPYTQATNSDVHTETNKSGSSSGLHVDLHLEHLFKTNAKRGDENLPVGKHPYEEEIAACVSQMSAEIFKEENTTVYGTLDETPCTFVVTEEELFNVAERLQRTVEIAVDIENHSIRSFQGFACLIQISTRCEDFVIDALALRGCIHRALAPVFADPSIVKVLHGADKDVQWLERDFGIYVVNMFDTGQAARLLKLPSASLSFLLTRFCDIVSADKKKFQTSDWRQRPLPDDMFAYARSDTHYLLYIYDRLRSEIGKKELTSQVWEKSAVVSRKRYRKIRFDRSMARHLAAKHGLGFDPHQMRMLEELCQWRDRIAREKDESLLYVAPLGCIFGLVRARDKVRTVDGFLKNGFPSRSVPPLMAKHAEELARLISDSLDAKVDEQNRCPHGPESKKRADDEEGCKFKSCNPDELAKRSADQAFVLSERVAAAAVINKGQVGLSSTKKESSAARVVPKNVKVSLKPKSTIFDQHSSDSSSSESEAEDTPVRKKRGLSQTPAAYEKDTAQQTNSGIPIAEDTVTPTESVRRTSGELRSPSPSINCNRTEDDVPVACQPRVPAVPKSTFDLSESDSDGGSGSGNGSCSDSASDSGSGDGSSSSGASGSCSDSDSDNRGGDENESHSKTIGEVSPLPTTALKATTEIFGALTRNVNKDMLSSADDIQTSRTRARDDMKEQDHPGTERSKVMRELKARLPHVKAARASVFELSDSEDESGEDSDDDVKTGANDKQETTEATARLERVAASMSGSGTPNLSGFRVETDIPESTLPTVAEERDTGNNADAEGEAEAEAEVEHISLLDAARKRRADGDAGRTSKRRRRGRAVGEAKATVEVAPVLPAFDYEKDGAIAGRNKRDGGFDPMIRLRVGGRTGEGGAAGGKMGKKVRKSRKTPRSGVRSMSFMGR